MSDDIAELYEAQVYPADEVVDQKNNFVNPMASSDTLILGSKTNSVGPGSRTYSSRMLGLHAKDQGPESSISLGSTDGKMPPAPHGVVGSTDDVDAHDDAASGIESNSKRLEINAKAMAEDAEKKEKKLKNRPTDSRFHQQQMHFCRPIISPVAWMGIFLIIGIVCIILSVPIFTAMAHMVEYKVVYGGSKEAGVMDLGDGEMTSHSTYWVACTNATNTRSAQDETSTPISTTGSSTTGSSTNVSSTTGSSTNVSSTNVSSTTGSSTTGSSTTGSGRRRLREKSLIDTLTQCNVTFTIGQDIPTPVYVYFQIEKFYQNHRSYTPSRNDQELGGMDVSFQKRAKTCGNNLFVDDDRERDLQRVARAADCDAGRFPPHSKECQHYSPCGLMARSFFTDRFSLVEPDNVVMDEENIANYWDRIRFRNRPNWDKLNSSETVSLLDQYGPILARGVEDPHFQVWSRSAATSDFRKLYGIITEPSTLKKGTKLSFAVESTFDVEGYDGHKSLVIATTSVFGGYNPALAPLFLVTGLMYLAMGFVILFKLNKEKKEMRRASKVVVHVTPR